MRTSGPKPRPGTHWSSEPCTHTNCTAGRALPAGDEPPPRGWIFPVRPENHRSVPCSPPAGCTVQTYDFLVELEKSSLEAGVRPPPAKPGLPCNSYVYKVRLTSAFLGAVLAPTFAFTVPAGME